MVDSGCPRGVSTKNANDSIYMREKRERVDVYETPPRKSAWRGALSAHPKAPPSTRQPLAVGVTTATGDRLVVLRPDLAPKFHPEWDWPAIDAAMAERGWVRREQSSPESLNGGSVGSVNLDSVDRTVRIEEEGK